MGSLSDGYVFIREKPLWRGVRVTKYPQDLILYAQVIFKQRPDFIIETGTHLGGSALFFGDMLQLIGGKKVFSIDVVDLNPPRHSMVEHILGSSTDPEIVNRIRRDVFGSSAMATLDSDHNAEHVLSELESYKDIVTSGQYIVVEDCWIRNHRKRDPYQAVETFLRSNSNYVRRNIEKQFVCAPLTKDGWLQRNR